MGNDGIAPLFLTSELDGCECSALCTGPFSPRERVPGIQQTVVWVVPRSGLATVDKRKSLARARNQTLAAQFIVRLWK
jgi:hypothetical protein